MTTTVTNVGQGDLVWSHGGCVTTVAVRGTMEERTYRPGIAHEGIAGEFKESVLAEDLIRGWPYIAFRPETLIGSYRGGCSDIGDSSRLGPGESIDLRVQWMVRCISGSASRRRARFTSRVRSVTTEGQGRRDPARGTRSSI